MNKSYDITPTVTFGEAKEDNTREGDPRERSLLNNFFCICTENVNHILCHIIASF